MTLGEILEENKGVGPGFDTLRLALATAVVVGTASASPTVEAAHRNCVGQQGNECSIKRT
jgi:hypothetical protein